jgi:hypothetical protein
MDLLYTLIAILIIASAFSGYLMVRAKQVERDIRKTDNYLLVTILLTILWMALVLIS